MRKFALSAFVILTFLFYSAHKRLEDAQKEKLESQNNLTVSSVPSALPSAMPSSDPIPSPTVSSNNNSSALPPKQISSQYKDGQYTGDSADAYYGFIQVKVTISGGKIADVVFLDYPQDRRTSIEINSQAMPYLKQEAIAAQSAQVDIVSGATDSSRAVVKSLQSALNKARS
jgi:uncharacterized protein with FMN-binding domain